MKKHVGKFVIIPTKCYLTYYLRNYRKSFSKNMRPVEILQDIGQIRTVYGYYVCSGKFDLGETMSRK